MTAIRKYVDLCLQDRARSELCGQVWNTRSQRDPQICTQKNTKTAVCDQIPETLNRLFLISTNTETLCQEYIWSSLATSCPYSMQWIQTDCYNAFILLFLLLIPRTDSIKGWENRKHFDKTNINLGLSPRGQGALFPQWKIKMQLQFDDLIYESNPALPNT